MHSIHTHYDNLQLTQSATDAEIRQAYRRLSKKYHPDLSDDPDAHRIMQIVNRAYEVLSNPESRAEHDKWIALQYLQKQQAPIHAQSITYYSDDNREPAPQQQRPTRQYTHSQQSHYSHYSSMYDDTPSRSHKRILMGLLGLSVILFGLLVWKGWGWIERGQLLPFLTGKSAQSSTTIVYDYPSAAQSTDTVSGSLQGEPYTRPTTAPNGSPFPEISGYVEGYPVIEGMGNGRLVIENVRNSSDVFAQLYEKSTAQPIRTFYILEREQMILPHLDAGDYFVRYYQLDNGEYLDSESVSLVRNQSATIYLLRGKSPTEQ